MKHQHTSLKVLSVLLALLVVFAANASSLLQLTQAMFPGYEEEEEDPWEEDPWSQPSQDPDPVIDPSSDTYTDPDPDTDPWEDPWWDDEEDPEPYIPPTRYTTEPPTDPPTEEPYSEQTYTPPSSRYYPSTTRAPQTSPTTTAAATTAPATTAPVIQSAVTKYAAAQEFLTDTQLDKKTINSSAKDENAVHIGGGNIIINEAKISRKNADSAPGDNADHYGVGSAVLATNGTGFISKSTISSEAKAATGAFSFGSAQLYLADTTVSTALDNAHGLETAETGKLYAWNMTVNTAGENASPIYTGPGGGTMVLDGGRYDSAGLKSPAVYCKGNIGLTNAELNAEESEAAVIENTGSLTITDCNITSDLRITPEHSRQWTVLLYQPGAKADHTADFRMKNGTITSKNGGLFYSTNTTSNIYLENVTLKPYRNSEFLIRCTGNSDETMWGERGKNGSVCNLTAANQELLGNVVWDAISEVSVYIRDNSTLTGAFVKDETVKRGPGFADLYIDKGCTWTVGGDSELSNLYNAGTIADTSGNPVTIKKADGTVIQEGTSAYTVIVASYSDKADMSGAQKAPDWTAATAVSRPAALGASLAEVTTETPTEPSTTPAKPDTTNEKRKQIAIYVLIGVGVLLVIAACIWLYQKNKYKIIKKLNNEE